MASDEPLQPADAERGVTAMKLEVFNNPFLSDFLVCAHSLAPDERAQVDALTGVEFDPDHLAADNFLVPGPKWVIKANGEPISVGGYVQLRNGVWQDYMLNTATAFAEHGFAITRICHRIMKAMFASGQAHRLQCIALATRTDVFRWYEALRMNKEGVLHGYAANGADCVMFARVEH